MFFRVQCKTARYQKGCIIANACTHPNRGNSPKKYEGVDIFAVYSPHTNKVYLIPFQDVDGFEIRLRIEKPLNNQEKGIKWASLYEASIAQ